MQEKWTIVKTEFIGSFPSEHQCPKSNLPEYAFIGRSNVGKSSLINMLTDRKELAKVSKKPGKTKLINQFRMDESWILTDLPGYGYAKVSKKERRAWEKMIESYLLQRKNLMCAFVLIDLRHPLQSNDLAFINWLGERQISFILVYTKADKVRPAKRAQHVKTIRNGLAEHWETLPPDFLTSATERLGKSELMEYIHQLNQQVLKLQS